MSETLRQTAEVALEALEAKGQENLPRHHKQVRLALEAALAAQVDVSDLQERFPESVKNAGRREAEEALQKIRNFNVDNRQSAITEVARATRTIVWAGDMWDTEVNDLLTELSHIALPLYKTWAEYTVDTLKNVREDQYNGIAIINAEEALTEALNRKLDVSELQTEFVELRDTLLAKKSADRRARRSSSSPNSQIQ